VANVRQTINEHRDESRAGLVRAKIQLACTTMTVGLITFALLWLALASGATTTQVQAAATYFLTGALIGVFARLRNEFDNDTAVEDFGLSAMRHFAAPQLAGVAAVLGVGLLTLSTMITQHSSDVQLASAFNLSMNPANILVAAVFGLTPSLIID